VTELDKLIIDIRLIPGWRISPLGHADHNEGMYVLVDDLELVLAKYQGRGAEYIKDAPL